MSPTCCGIVTYNPKLSRLKENIEAISPQVSKIFIYDNGSDNVSDIVNIFQKQNCTVINSGTNSGMAIALNRLAEQAINNGFLYIIFLDQDSVAQPNMVNELSILMKDDIGITCPAIIDRNSPDKRDENPFLADVTHTITSGSLVNLAAYKKVGGYDERLFIDWVDLDYCHNLRLHGYKILRTKSAQLLHEIGKKEFVMALPRKCSDGKWHLRKYYRTNHSLLRQEDKARSQTIIAHKYKNTPIEKEVMKPITETNFSDFVLEKHRFQLAKAKYQGRKQGIKELKKHPKPL